MLSRPDCRFGPDAGASVSRFGADAGASVSRFGADAGASMLIALSIIVAVLGFGAVAIQIASDDLSSTSRMESRERALLNAELGVSEATSRIIEGATTEFSSSGTIDGDAYAYKAAPNGDGSWTITATAGSAPDQREVVATLVREVTGGGGSGPGPTPIPVTYEYALWAGMIKSDKSTGTMNGAIGASSEIKIEGSSIGTAQHLLNGAKCGGCANPVAITSYVPPEQPSAAGAKACPLTKKDEIKNTTIPAGTYLCDGSKLKFKGTVSVSGPVVIILGNGTDLEMKSVRVNQGGDAANLVIAQPAGGNGEVKIENSTFAGHILMPGAVAEIKKNVTWSGTVTLGEAKFDKAKLTVTMVAYSASSGGGGPTTTTSGDRYAVFTESLLDIGWVRSGDVDGSVGSRKTIKFWYSHRIGDSQDYVSGGTCINCPNPKVISDYDTLPLPSSAGAASCPADGTYRITSLTLGGSYLCGRSSATLRISGTINIIGPTVIHVGPSTRIDIRDARINAGGDSADFLIVQPSVQSFAYRAVIDDTTMHGRILTPATWWYVGDVTWRGTFEVGSWWLYDWANIDGAWDGTTGSDPKTETWKITAWEID